MEYQKKKKKKKIVRQYKKQITHQMLHHLITV